MGKYKLKDIFQKPISGEWGNEPNDDFVEIIKTNNILEFGKIDFVNTTQRDIDSKKIETKKLEFGDILVEKSGGSPEKPVGRVCFFDKYEGTYLTNNFMSSLRLNNENFDSKYVFYYLFNLYKKRVVLNFQNQTTGIINLKLDRYLSEISINEIEIYKQKQIAKTLDKAQELIDFRKESIAKLDELAKSIFIDMFGDPVSNPKGWEVKKIADLGKVQTGNTPPRAEADNYGNYLEWIKSDNILRDKIVITEAREYLSQKGAKKGRIAEKGSLLFTCIAGSMLSIGNLGYVDRTVAFNQQINSLTPINNNSLYLYFLFTLSKQVFEESSTKSMKIMVNKSTFEGLIFPVAPIELQNKFATIIEKIESQKSLYEQELEKLEENFQALLQQSFKE